MNRETETTPHVSRLTLHDLRKVKSESENENNVSHFTSHASRLVQNMIEEKNIETTNEVLVKVEGLSKKFCKDLKTSLWYGVKDLISNIHGNKNERLLRDKEFWAVKDINFELRRGECLGLIGHNGAGKSTLLKILNGLINPDAGKVTIKGRVGALIELGAGFNPILSGRENIYNNGAVLGFTKKEIDAKVEDIIDFAEIREFIDMPVQNYSSGMKVRLGFAVAVQMEPDVLIIDEVLAVGDVSFRAKCYDKISKIISNCAIIYVSHSMPSINRISTFVMHINKGKSKIFYNIGEGINEYLFTSTNQHKNIKFSIPEVTIDNFPEIIAVRTSNEIYYQFDLKVVGFKFKNASLYLNILSGDQLPICFNYIQISDEIDSKRKFIFHVEKNLLASGEYYVSIVIYDNGGREQVLWYQNITKIKVEGENHFRAPIIIDGKWKIV
ncbi:Teichoic acids export ATP-binding protein TagH [Mariniflexile rhizosphaerae]|uniref:ABC transporter ATP-binding protein n=2 Tax=Mariniflexile TaxID=527198 RepID=UPI000E336352|nr:Teichoic acids export ATP-binding protein TagH [Mariniflexile sp. TRM1-10]